MDDTELLVRRLAAIQCIVEQSGDIGKTRIQKMVYFLQEVSGVQLRYSFRMHLYGPYSDDVDSGISALRVAGYVKESHYANGYGYHITPTSASQLPWDTELAEHREEMNRAIGKLGVLHVNDLELWATIHFVQQLLNEPTRESVIENVRRLKPRFTAEQIGAAYDQLVEADLMAAAPTS